MTRIIKKAITTVLLARIARRNYTSSSSSIFINSQLKNSSSTNISRSSLLYQIGTLNREFSSSSSIGKKGPSGSDQIIGAGDEAAEHLLKKVVETPSEFPFKIEDKPWEQTITLIGDYGGDEVKVIVHMPTHHSSTTGDDQNHVHSASDPQPSIRLVVTQTNFLGTTLEYGVIAYPDDFFIDSFCVKYSRIPEENIYYRGPDYAKLDNNLRREFQRRLKIRGIIPSTTRFLHEYMANRDICSSDSSNSPAPTPTPDESTHESVETTVFNDEGFPVDPDIEIYRQRGHPLVSAEDIRNSGKNPKDFRWIPYPYTRSEKLLWIEVPSEGFYASESESEYFDDEYWRSDNAEIFLDGEAYNDNPYRCLPPKLFGDPTVISEEMDKILYPDLIHVNDPEKAWEELGVALRAHNDVMNKIKYSDTYSQE
ncbi:hypothetical protein MKW92_053736 [Papaver armeniacum]|nr:hypothetical protein MKW92_053736 [Papaver armeniacum]